MTVPCLLHGIDFDRCNNTCRPHGRAATAVLQAREETAEDGNEIDLDALCAAVRALGHEDAYVEQTGGGCATLFAGGTYTDAHGDQRWRAAAGPGWFDGPGWTNGRAALGDFYVGPDDGEDDEAVHCCMPGESLDSIAARIDALVRSARTAEEEVAAAAAVPAEECHFCLGSGCQSCGYTGRGDTHDPDCDCDDCATASAGEAR